MSVTSQLSKTLGGVLGAASSRLDSATSTLRSKGGARIRDGIIGDQGLKFEELASEEDPGWFGPSSISWRVHGDASMLSGGLRSLFLQTLHPLAMAGIAQHSDYRRDPWGRLNRTSRFVGATTFGSTATAERSIASVTQVHGAVKGIAADGRAYSARDPHLLLWVHVCEIDSFLTCFERYGNGKLRDADRDRYVCEQAEVARRLGAQTPPESAAELAACLESFRAECTVTPAAIEAIAFLSAPPLPWYMRGTYATLVGGAVASLPTWAADELRLSVPPFADGFALKPMASATTSMLRYLMSADR